MKERRLAPYARYLRELGIDLNEAGITGANHLKIQVTYQGNHRFFIAPGTPSDRRSFLNWKSDVKKWQKQVRKEATNASTDQRRDL